MRGAVAGGHVRVSRVPRSSRVPFSDERVEPPVTVEVDQRHAAAVGLDDEALALDAAVDDRDA